MTIPRQRRQEHPAALAKGVLAAKPARARRVHSPAGQARGGLALQEDWGAKAEQTKEGLDKQVLQPEARDKLEQAKVALDRQVWDREAREVPEALEKVGPELDKVAQGQQAPTVAPPGVSLEAQQARQELRGHRPFVGMERSTTQRCVTGKILEEKHAPEPCPEATARWGARATARRSTPRAAT